MVNRITGCGNSDGEFIDIEPVEYVRDQCQYQLVKRIAELEAKNKKQKPALEYVLKAYADLLHNSVEKLNKLDTVLLSLEGWQETHNCGCYVELKEALK